MTPNVNLSTRRCVVRFTLRTYYPWKKVSGDQRLERLEADPDAMEKKEFIPLMRSNFRLVGRVDIVLTELSWPSRNVLRLLSDLGHAVA
jgi:hypothetical protein